MSGGKIGKNTVEHVVHDRLADAAVRHGRNVRTSPVWCSVDCPRLALPTQGWKIHVSARPSTLATTLDVVLPVLLPAACSFKVARSTEILRWLNFGRDEPTQIGKAITVYPDQSDLLDMAHALAEALVGYEGPRIVSDRRVRPDAPVWYRFGPFSPRYRMTSAGEFELVVVDPSGGEHPGAARPAFWCPPWAEDPFVSSRHQSCVTEPGTTIPAPADPPNGAAQERSMVLGGRYRLTAGIQWTGKGNVYRAQDMSTATEVIVKEARAWVLEKVDGIDARVRLRHEYLVLEALHGLNSVPRVVDHFRHGLDEFLVLSSVGDRSLRQDVADHGWYPPTGTGRDLTTLACHLLALLDAAHNRSVIVRDLAPKNVILGDDDRYSLIDFEISRLGSEQFHGFSLGYSSPQQLDDEPGTAADDYYSLGATLFHAATGLEPVYADTEPARNFNRTASVLRAIHPQPHPLHLLILQLLDPDAAHRETAAERLRTGWHQQPALCLPVTAAIPTPESSGCESEQLAQITAHILTECVRHGQAMLETPDLRHGEPPRYTQVYQGSAGLGMELLQHLDNVEAAQTAHQLARWTAEATVPEPALPSLFFGTTGTAIFLAAAAHIFEDNELKPGKPTLDCHALEQVTSTDYTYGLAGIGAGALLLADLTGDDQYQGIATQCTTLLVRRDLVREAHDTLHESWATGENTPGYGIAVPYGFAHGLAGTAYYLLAYHIHTGDQTIVPRLEQAYLALAEKAKELVAETVTPKARPMSISWCQGLAGIGSSLLYASHNLPGHDYLGLAEEAAHACLTVAPRAYVLSQCCGLAGLGEFFIDLYAATGDPEHRRWAEYIFALMLTRAAGPDDAPTFPDHSLKESSGTWGNGSAGILAFLRRLGDNGGPRPWLPGSSWPRR